MDRAFYNNYIFFLHHAGYRKDVAEAVALAKAEQRAADLGWTFLWSQDHDPDLSWLEREGFEHHKARYETGERYPMVCDLYSTGGGHYGSLSGIDMGDTPEDDQYRRVVQAELALQAIEEHGDHDLEEDGDPASHSITVNIAVKDGGSREDAIDMLLEALDEYRANVDEDQDMIEHFTIEGSDEDDEHDPAPLHGICQRCGQEIRE